MKKHRVPRTRNLGNWTEAQFWGRIRSALRNVSKFWKPAQEAKLKARKPYKGKGRQKWEYKCNHCKRMFPSNKVAIDHIIPSGSLRNADDLKPFVEKLFREDPNDYQILCNYKLSEQKKYGGVPSCHYVKTQEERKNGRS